MELQATSISPAAQVPQAWWRLNLRLVGAGVCAWLLITLLGAQAAADAAVSSLQFILSAQWIPLLYLALVVTYCATVNRWMAREAFKAADGSAPVSDQL